MCCIVLKNIYIFVMQITMLDLVVFLKKFFTECNDNKKQSS